MSEGPDIAASACAGAVKIALVAGEASGDNLGGGLLRALHATAADAVCVRRGRTAHGGGGL